VKIAVCIKRVPEMDVRFRIAASGTGVDETGLKFDMSDFDGYAVEFGLQLTEKLGAGDVTVISLGPDAVQETLRKALSMGAARAVQLKADPVPFDGFAVARALAAELRGGGYDLILFGKLAADTAARSWRSPTGRGPRGARSKAALSRCRSRSRPRRRSTKGSRVPATHRSRESWRPGRSPST
jgi:hypothetical protein